MEITSSLSLVDFARCTFNLAAVISTPVDIVTTMIAAIVRSPKENLCQRYSHTAQNERAREEASAKKR